MLAFLLTGEGYMQRFTEELRQKEQDLEFFVKHGPMDVHHASLLLEAMLPHLERKEDQEALRSGALRSLGARLILMNGLYRIVWG
jgi:pyrroloquinoline-quinone synthase